jgi:hypothetical protein
MQRSERDYGGRTSSYKDTKPLAFAGAFQALAIDLLRRTACLLAGVTRGLCPWSGNCSSCRRTSPSNVFGSCLRTQNDCGIHPYECGCDDDKSPYDTFNHYLKAFFIHSSSTPLQANHFRFEATDRYRVNGPHPAAYYEMEMTSSAGKTWKYERYAYSQCMFYHILYNKMETCAFDGPACNERFGVSAAIVRLEPALKLILPSSEQFDGLDLANAKGEIASLTFRTYFYLPPGFTVCPSFARISFSRFGEELRVMASHQLGLKNLDANVNFDFFVHHGDRRREPRECMKPVFSLRIVNGGPDQKAIIDNLYVDEEFLGCRKNRGCERCR